jgi:Protein of unknown function (DUF2800).
MPTVHAKLSASGAHKWLYAPTTLWMEEGLPDFTSKFAEEGTAAHTLVELKIKHANGQITDKQFKERFKSFTESTGFYSKAMEDYTDQHVDLVIAAYYRRKSATFLSEQQVNFDKWVPGGFGTADTIIVDDDILEIWDLKYGKGVRVRADHNVQLMLYALGAYDIFGAVYDFDKIRIVISQPRIGNFDSFEISVEELLAWGDGVVKVAADKALNGEGPDDWDDPQTWAFYKAMGFDRALAQYNLRIRKYKFKAANTLSPEEVADIIAQAPRLRKWLDAVEAYAKARLLDHQDVPGFKVVAGRANRVIKDKAGAGQRLVDAGFDPQDVYKPQDLQALGKLEHVVGKKQLTELLGDLIVKPEGKPTLVTTDDKRPSLDKMTQAQNDFDK